MAVGPDTIPDEHNKLQQNGWRSSDAISMNNGKCIVLWRECKQGETFRIRTQMYFGPLIIQ